MGVLVIRPRHIPGLRGLRRTARRIRPPRGAVPAPNPRLLARRLNHSILKSDSRLWGRPRPVARPVSRSPLSHRGAKTHVLWPGGGAPEERKLPDKGVLAPSRTPARVVL